MLSPNCYSDSALDSIKCCFEECRPKIDYCISKCNDDFCLQTCERLRQECQDICRSIPSKGLSTIRQCALDSCANILDPSCFNKDTIVSCCRQKCGQDIDCSRCDELYDHFIQETPRLSYYKNTKHNKKTALFFLFAILILVFLIKMKFWRKIKRYL